MCEQCEGLAQKVRIKLPFEYLNIVNQIKEFIDEELLSLVQGNCDINSIDVNNAWPQDYIEHIFRCNKCDQHFKLSVETYHGSGGSWEPVHYTGTIEVYTEAFDQTQWSTFVDICKRDYNSLPPDVQGSLDDFKIAEDLKIVLLCKLRTYSKEGLGKELPAMGGVKPMDLLRSEEGTKALKVALQRLPD